MQTKNLFTILIFVLMLAVTVSSASAAGFYITDSKITDSTGSTTKTTVSPGESVRLYMQATNGNTGTGSDPAAFTYTIYKSGATVAGPAGTSNIIARGTSYWKYFSYNIPTTWSGTYTYKAAVTPCSTTGYCDRTITFTVGGTPSTPASFTTSSVSATDTSGGTRTSFAQGQSFKLVANVRNTGTSSGTATVSYSLTKSGTTYCTGTQSGTVSGGSSSNIQKSCSALSTWPVGDYTYTATVSPCSSSCSKSMIISITSSTPAAANFNVYALRLTDSTGTPKTSFRQGEIVYARPTVRNTGTATGTVYINSYIRKASVLITSSSMSYSLGVGSSYEALYTYITTTSVPGTYEYEAAVSPCSSGTCSRRVNFTITSVVCTDAYACRDSTTTSHTLTNCTIVYTACPSGQTCSGAGVCSTPPTAAFSLDSVWLTTTSGVTATSFAQGASAMLKATVRNTATVSGTERTDFSITKDGSVLYQANQSHSVGAGATYTEARTTTIPATWGNGTYYLTARVSPCSSGTCERTTAFSVTRSCTAWTRTCFNSTYYGYQMADCSVAYPYACTSGRVCSAGSCVLPTCNPATCGPHSHCGTTACVCDTNYSDDDGNLADGCEINLMNDTRNCGRVGNACTSGQTCTLGSCVDDLLSYTPEEIYSMAERPIAIVVGPALLRQVMLDAIADGRAHEFYSTLAEPEAQEALRSIAERILSMDKTEFTVLRLTYESDYLLHQIYLRDSSRAFLVTRGDNRFIYTMDVAEEPIDIEARVSQLEQASGILNFVQMKMAFDQGVREYNGSWAHAFVAVGEEIVQSGELVTIVTAGAIELGIVGSGAAVPVTVLLVVGQIVPELNVMNIVSDFMSEIAADAHRAADGVDFCFSSVDNMVYCNTEYEELRQLAMLIISNPWPVIDNVRIDQGFDTGILRVDYDMHNRHNIARGRVGYRLVVNTTSGVYRIPLFDDVVPGEEFSDSYTHALLSGEDLLSVELVTYSACPSYETSECRLIGDSRMILAPTATFTADRTTFTEGDTITLQAKANFRDEDAGSTAPIAQLFMTSPVMENVSRSEYACSDAEECGTYTIRTSEGDAGSYQLEYRIDNRWGLSVRKKMNITILPRPAAPPAPTYTITLLSPVNGGSATWYPQNFSWTHNTNFTEYILNFYNATRITNTVNASMASSCTTPTRCKLYGYLSLPRAGQYWWNITGKLNTGEKIVSETKTFNWS